MTALLRAAFVTSGVLLVACEPEVEPAASPCEEEDRAQSLAPGLAAEGALAVTLLAAAPIPPAVGDNTWTLAVEGDCAVSVSLWMPDHGHGAADPPVTDLGDGEHAVVPGFTMGGLWEVTVQCGEQEALFSVCVES